MRIGIIGSGHIGRTCARLCRAVHAGNAIYVLLQLFRTNSGIAARTPRGWNNGCPASTGRNHGDLRIDDRRTDDPLAAFKLLA